MPCVIISTSLSESPVSRYYRSLAEQFIKKGYKVVFIFDQQIVELPKNTDCISYFTWPSRRPTRFIDFIFLRRLIKRFRPKITISVFGSVNVMTIMSYLYRVEKRIAWVRTTSDQILRDSKSRVKSLLFQKRKRFVYRLCTHICANSLGTKNDTSLVFKIPETKIIVLHNLIEQSKIKLRSRADRELEITVVGRLHPSKGHINLLNQFTLVVEKYPQMKLNIIGDGPLRKSLEQFVDDKNITKRVVFHGNLPHERVGNILSKSLIGLSSSYSEAFGWVSIEALKEGTPICCSPTEGSNDILIESVNGEFMDHQNLESLVVAIDKILVNWEGYSNAALTTFFDRFDLGNVIKVHSDKLLQS